MPAHNVPGIDIGQMKKHYRFDEKDALRLETLRPLAERLADTLLDGFYTFIFGFEHASVFLHTPAQLQRHRKEIRRWFLELFCGRYDEAYFRRLEHISEIHIKIGLPSHYVNSAFSYIREFLEENLHKAGKSSSLPSVHKILDINLDILSLSYFEEGRKQLIEHVVLIRHAVDAHGVIPYVHPIIDLRNAAEEKRKKYECLMRLRDKDGEVHSVFPLLKTAKSLRLYDNLMRQMIARCFNIFETLPHDFSINLSFEDINNASFLAFLYDKLETFPQPERITFEILETDFVFDFSIVTQFIDTVRTYGCRIAIDDFGAGYSNLENILKFRPDYLKIDGSLIKNVDTDEHSRSVVKNIVNMAKELHIRTIAEFVYNRAVYDTLKILGVDYAQGFYICEPFPAERLTKKACDTYVQDTFKYGRPH
jgi:EAL domain-containing protein (putative c-di-GMP-specific phosphodiesterase class I)